MLRPNYPLRTSRLRLRPYTDDDLAALYEIERRSETARYLYNAPLTLDDTRPVLERRKAMTSIDDEHDGLMLALTLADSDAVIGHVNLERTSPDHQGRGYASEAAALMLRLGFEELGLHRIVGRLDARNAPSARVLERLGMRREAHLHEIEFVKGEWVDELVYAILADEWRQAHEAG